MNHYLIWETTKPMKPSWWRRLFRLQCRDVFSWPGGGYRCTGRDGHASKHKAPLRAVDEWDDPPPPEPSRGELTVRAYVDAQLGSDWRRPDAAFEADR